MKIESSLTQARKVVVTVFLLLATTNLSYSQKMGPPPPDFLVTTPSKYDFSDTVDILKGAIEEQNLMVVHEIDAQQMLRMVQQETGGMKQILFFHPRYMKQIIQANKNAGIAPPLKFIVMERPDGKVMVRYEKPTHVFKVYEGTAEIASELQGIVEEIAAEVKS